MSVPQNKGVSAVSRPCSAGTKENDRLFHSARFSVFRPCFCLARRQGQAVFPSSLVLPRLRHFFRSLPAAFNVVPAPFFPSAPSDASFLSRRRCKGERPSFRSSFVLARPHGILFRSRPAFRTSLFLLSNESLRMPSVLQKNKGGH